LATALPQHPYPPWRRHIVLGRSHWLTGAPIDRHVVMWLLRTLYVLLLFSMYVCQSILSVKLFYCIIVILFLVCKCYLMIMAAWWTD
jgi:hypothetical protein